jgi:CDP-paratose 2-epimerase
MATAIVTGSGGLIGSEAVRRFARDGYEVVGVDNDARSAFFGTDASTRAVSEGLLEEVTRFEWRSIDIRDAEAIDALFAERGEDTELVVHAAAQPSHDWAARAPQVDFGINANGTLNLLEATRRHAPAATFAFLSTNKVYGDTPNSLPLVELETRLELPEDHRWYPGIDTAMSIDSCTHSLFGVSKTAADLLVQEYGSYFGMATACFRCGCLTGPAHAGAKLHGFLAYLMKCAATRERYTVIGYEGKQVRDNLHAADVAAALAAFHAAPTPARVYNLGGGRVSNCSVIEAIAACERITGAEMDIAFDPEPRVGDHRWWISDLTSFQSDYPGWSPDYDTDSILEEIFEQNCERWMANA